MLARLYLKLGEEKRARAHPPQYWSCLVPKTSDTLILEAAVRTLERFKGCWVKADTILCQLRDVQASPRFSLVVWGNGLEWMWFPLGTTVELHLPYEKPS